MFKGRAAADCLWPIAPGRQAHAHVGNGHEPAEGLGTEDVQLRALSGSCGPQERRPFHIHGTRGRWTA